jgi:hypothetical protein
MEDFTIQVRRTLLQMTMLVTAEAVVAAAAGHASVIPGLVLGAAGSGVYFLLMGYRVRRAAELPADKAVAYTRAGWIVRLSFIVLILVLSLKIPQVNFPAAVLGLFSLQIVLIVNAVLTVAGAKLSGPRQR